MHASQYGDLILMRQLLAKGGDLSARNRFDQTPLMFAVGLNDPAAAAPLVEGAADEGQTALAPAVKKGHTTIVQLLKKAGWSE